MSSIAKWTGSVWGIQTVSSAGDFWYVSLTLDSNNNPNILYETGKIPSLFCCSFLLRRVRQMNNSTNYWQTQTILQGNVELQDMALDSKDNLHFIYFNESRGDNVTLSNSNV